MRIALPAEGPGLDARLGHKLGSSPYLIIVDPETREFEAVPNPGASGQRGAGVQMVVLAISREVDALLTSFASPAVQKQLSDAGIDVVTGLTGTVDQVVEQYRLRQLGGRRVAGTGTRRSDLLQALRSSARQFCSILPVLIGVVLLMGLFNAFVSREALASVFSGNTALDALWGACFGSILAGNPITSYVIGAGLQEQGVSMYAVTSLIVAWVTVGLVQIPAEAAALGTKFAVVRNAVCFVSAIAVAMATVTILNLVEG